MATKTNVSPGCGWCCDKPSSVSCPFKNNIFTFYGLGPPFAKPWRDEVVKLVSRCTFCGQFQPAEFPISGPVTRRYSTMKCADTPNPPIFWRFKSRLLCLCLIGKRTLDGVCGSCTENKNHAVTAFCQTWFRCTPKTNNSEVPFFGIGSCLTLVWIRINLRDPPIWQW